ncbi:hypothetical protein ACI2KT_34120 [Ensifer adhaerens]|uniref:hypothetical protein n=1 Tax=Ensifer adhaerens TaxID=106592 RepID=UPI00384DC3C6
MHIVDEILAYRDLAERGTAPENIAARFGQSVITVRQRLKLAHLSSKILDVMREDKMSLEQARALAISDSHDEQERAWFNTVQWNRDPHSLRSLLTSEHVRSTNRLAVFVGMDAYEAAGGVVLRDLFADNAATFLTDPALLNQLASAALEQAAEPMKAEGWKWVEPSLDANALHRGGFGRIYAKAREFTDDEQARLSALAERYDELAAEIDGLPEGDDLHAAEEKLTVVETEMEAIQNGVKAYDPQEMAWAGCIVTVDQSGTVQVNRGYVAPEDMAGLAQLRRGLAETDADADGEDGDGGEAPALPDDEAQPELTYSAPLVEELTAIRTAALRVEVAGNVHIALAALLHPLVSAEI